ncbi:MAG: nucleotide-binding protein [Gallionellaceae bacterium]|nr:nucleotide-binding protein [Gallionellaceae bacterium]
MKFLLSMTLFMLSQLCWGIEQINPATHPAITVEGVVLETTDVENFTYLRLNTKNGETWAAVINSRIAAGAHVTLENVTVMNNFESKSLKKTFPTILFGSLAAPGKPKGGSLGVEKYMSIAYPGMNGAKTPSTSNAPSKVADEMVAKASGSNAVTVEEVLTKSSALKGKSVLVKGKVVKYNAGIMGKNWIHLRDGSGKEDLSTNDILVTTHDEVQVGEVITIKGIVATNKDFGAGYSYKVLIEEATLQR